MVKLHVKHNFGGFVFDKVRSFETLKELSVEVNQVIKAISAFNCEHKYIDFEVAYKESFVKKTVLCKEYRPADREMDKFLKGLAYIWPEMR